MESFVTLERAIACPHASAAVVADTAAQILTSAGYRRGLGFGPTQSYVRAHRPVWAVALGLVLAIPTVGISLLLLRVRKDHCNVVIEDGPYGVVALVSGRVPAALPSLLESASGSYPEQQHSAPGADPSQPPPMLLTPSSGGFDRNPQQQSAILRPATPVPGLFPQHPSPPADGGRGYPNGPAGPGSGQGRPGGPAAPYPQPGYPGAPAYAQQQPPYGQQPPASPPPFPEPPRFPEAQPFPDPQRFPEPQRFPQAQPFPDPSAAPVAHRPPSRLAPAPPADAPPGRPPAPAPAREPARQADDDPFSSTSGRVPWAVAGGRSSLPAPAGPPPVSPGAWSPTGAPPVPSGAGSHGSHSGGAARGGGSGAPGDGTRRITQGAVATAVGQHGFVLRVDSGETLELGPFCLLGREPVARDGDPPAVLVPFVDAKLSVSKTHIAYGVDERGVWVMDRNSTNGTSVIDPAGRRVPCAPGAREYLQVGAQIQIGQRRLTVETADGAAG